MGRRPLLLAVLLPAAILFWTTPAAGEHREEELLRNADRVAAEVAGLRGLEARREIRRGVLGREEITRRLLERIRQEYSEEEIAAESLALKRLGLLAPDADYLKLVLALLTDQVAGFYDPWERRLYLANWTTFGGDMLLAHEITHALQDQHFDLQRLMKRGAEGSDALLARQALIEGDGTALMLEYSMDQLGETVPWGQPAFVEKIGASITSALAAAARDAPLVLRDGLVFPYMHGLRFVGHFRRHHPWRRVDEIYARPPLSTEHILHPEKYEAYERPDRIEEVKAPTLAAYEKLYDDVSGELGLSVFLRHHGVEERKAARAAAGWGGDRLVLYAPPDHDGAVAGTLAVHYSTWDEEADAIEFFEALEEVLPAVTGGREVSRRGHLIERRTRRGAVAYAERRGIAVLLVLGAPPARAEEVRRQVWEGWRVTRSGSSR